MVRIGTHALKPASRTSLWQRLSRHRGSSRSGAGNHRGSIFGLLVGVALARRAEATPPPSWGVGSDAGAAARKLGLDCATVKCDEADLERRVSECIGRMPLLWLGVNDPPGPTSMRGVIERNAIALLSNASRRFPVRPVAGRVQQSGDGARFRTVEQPSRRRASRLFVSGRNGSARDPVA